MTIEGLSGQEAARKCCKIQSEHSAVISGLKCFLQEFANEQVCNVVENCFNLDAEPFTPKKQHSVGSSTVPLDLGFAQTPIQKSEGTAQEQILERKRQISQMYQYYNYLIFEKNKESFNVINPDLTKMTYKYDTEVKNAYMTL